MPKPESNHQTLARGRGRGEFIPFDKFCDLLRKHGFIDCATWDLDAEQAFAVNGMIEDLDEHYETMKETEGKGQ